VRFLTYEQIQQDKPAAIHDLAGFMGGDLSEQELAQGVRAVL